jgi:aspartate ammonia-lyase
MRLLSGLENELVLLQEAFQQKEQEFSHIVIVARTQLQDAVLTTLGRSMSAYAEAFGRDRWRIYKCTERLRVVNLGGTAIGSGIGAPRNYIFKVVDVLRDITGLNLARAENLTEATQNTDVFVEVSGILKALASSLLKCSTDLRLLSSGPETGICELSLPKRQAGSSIMPGKVNPVIPEAVSQAAISVIAMDLSVTYSSSLGNLELNQFMPLIADSLLNSITLLSHACKILRKHCITGLKANEATCQNHASSTTALATALVEVLGYELASDVIKRATKEGISVQEAALRENLLDELQFEELIKPESVCRLGSPPKKKA